MRIVTIENGGTEQLGWKVTTTDPSAPEGWHEYEDTMEFALQEAKKIGWDRIIIKK